MILLRIAAADPTVCSGFNARFKWVWYLQLILRFSTVFLHPPQLIRISVADLIVSLNPNEKLSTLLWLFDEYFENGIEEKMINFSICNVISLTSPGTWWSSTHQKLSEGIRKSDSRTQSAGGKMQILLKPKKHNTCFYLAKTTSGIICITIYHLTAHLQNLLSNTYVAKEKKMSLLYIRIY